MTQMHRAPGPLYVTPELIPQGAQLDQSIRGAPMLIMFTNPQQPRYGMGLTSITPTPQVQIIPGQGPINRGM